MIEGDCEIQLCK